MTSLQYLWNIVGVLYDIIDNTIAGDLYDAASYSQVLLAIVAHVGALNNALNLQYFKQNLSVTKGINFYDCMYTKQLSMKFIDRAILHQ